MELKNLENYKTSFELVKYIVIVVIIMCIGLTGFAIYYTEKQKQKYERLVYVMDKSGNIAIAQGLEQKETRIYEYENHVRMFFKLWYQFDEGSFVKNIESALPLTGETGKELLKQYEENNMLRQLKERNLNLTVSDIEIEVNEDTNPVSGRIQGTQIIRRGSNERKRMIMATFDLYDFSRSRENPHGIKIENWIAREQRDE